MKVVDYIDKCYEAQLNKQNETIEQCAKSVTKFYNIYEDCFNDDNLIKLHRKQQIISSKEGIDIEMEKLMKLRDMSYNIDIMMNKSVANRFFEQCLNVSNIHVDILPPMKTPEIILSAMKWEAPIIPKDVIKMLSDYNDDNNKEDKLLIQYQIFYRGIKI
eukprot:770524_1